MSLFWCMAASFIGVCVTNLNVDHKRGGVYSDQYHPDHNLYQATPHTSKAKQSIMRVSSSSTTTRINHLRSLPAPSSRNTRLSVTCFTGNNNSKQTPNSKVTTTIKAPAWSRTAPALIKEEQQSLRAALQAAGLEADDAAGSAVAKLSPQAQQELLSTISRGLNKDEKDLGKLEGAMLLAEQLFHASGGNMGAVTGGKGTAASAADPQAIHVWQVCMPEQGVVLETEGAVVLLNTALCSCIVLMQACSAAEQVPTCHTNMHKPFAKCISLHLLPSHFPTPLCTQPVFASAGGFPRLLYIPVPEYFDMHRALPDATAISVSSVTGSIDASSSADRASAAAGPGGRINIITELGPLTTHFLGTCSWLDDTTFEYSINTLRLDLGGRSISLGLGPFKLENQLAFFMTTPEFACARSKLGGTMLLAAEPSAGKAYADSW